MTQQRAPEGAPVPVRVLDQLRDAWRTPDLAFRVLAIVASVLFFKVFSLALFVVYMARHGFYDYGFFAGGAFSLSIFFGTAELMVVLFSVTVFGAVVPLLAPRKTARHWLAFALLLMANALVMWWLLPIVTRAPDRMQGFVFFALLLLIATQVAMLLNRSARDAFLSLLVVFLIVAAFTSVQPGLMTGLLSQGLRVFNVGGMVPVVVARGNQAPRKGSLVFLGPSHVFVWYDAAERLSIEPRSPDVLIEVENDKLLEHVKKSPRAAY